MTTSYFEGIEKHIMSRLDSSQSSIFVAVAWFTNQLLFDTLTDALKKNVTVKILILNDLLNRSEFGLDFGILTKLGAEVRFAKSDLGTMHNKFCIIDNTVITGSYNWTYHANKNSENILITDEEGVVNGYREEFDRLFREATAIPQPYEHQKWTDVNEGDFSELRRNIFREVVAKNDENCELIRNKLIHLNQAYKTGDIEKLVKASSFATKRHLRTIIDVLTNRSQDYVFGLWEENLFDDCKPYEDANVYGNISKWFYIPLAFKDDLYHREYIEGRLKISTRRNDIWVKGLKLNIFDKDFINSIKAVLGSRHLSEDTIMYIPDFLLCINLAKMFVFKFPSPMFNKNQSRFCANTEPRTRSGINLLGIIKEVNGDEIVFYDGWDPQKRGELIMKKYFEI